MMKANKSGQNVRIEYIFDASRDQVFEAWINPDHLKNWYAPDGCTVFIKECNPVEGGFFHYCIKHPVHGSGWAIGEFLKIKRPEKIIQRVTISDETGKPVDPRVLGMDPDWPQQTLLTITLEDWGGKTKMILEENVNEDFAKKTGAYPGWIQMFDRLNGTFLATIK